MSKPINYAEPLRGFEQQPDAAVNEINGLRFTLRRVIEQREYVKAERDYWQLRYAEVSQQLDEERRKTAGGDDAK
jgi:hypothetical protein